MSTLLECPTRAHYRYLPRLSIDSETYHHQTSSASSMSSLSSSTRASFASSFESNASAESFFVFCVYDFEAADADQLSFRSNEILEIVKQEESVSHRYSAYKRHQSLTLDVYRAGGLPSDKATTEWAGYRALTSNPSQKAQSRSCTPTTGTDNDAGKPLRTTTIAIMIPTTRWSIHICNPSLASNTSGCLCSIVAGK